MKQKVLIIGAGEIGQALSGVLKAKRGLEIKFWDKNPKLSSQKDIGALIEEAQYIFLCSPSSALHQVAATIKAFLKKKTLVISLVKGIEGERQRFSSEILKGYLGKNKIAILAGPMLAEELNQGLPTKATLGSTRRVFGRVDKLLQGTNLGIEHSPDIQGVSIAGVLKNIYALGFGIVDGLDMGLNTKGVFMNLALSEMESLIKKLGGDPRTAHMLAGIGDLEATGNSTFSKNFTVGQKLAKGSKAKLFSEGLISLEPLVKRIGRQNLPPAISAVYRVSKNPKRAAGIFKNLIKNA